MSAPSSPRPPWLETALRHQIAGRSAEAERIYDGVLRANPQEPDALNLMGVIAASRGRYDAAIALIGRAIAARPGRGDFYAWLGNIHLMRGDFAGLAENYRRALRLSHFGAVPAPFQELAVQAGRVTAAPDFSGVELYCSQFLQDVYLDNWVFGRMRGGVFVDIGAHDGVTFSNSSFFEAARAWTGICIEPNPDVFARLRANRRCVALDCCVAAEPGVVPFRKLSGYSEMLSGIATNYHPEHRERIEKELAEQGGVSQMVEVPARTLSDIAAEHAISEIHCLSVDTEGSEFEILKSIPFDRLFVHAATVECNFEQERAPMVALMAKAGFEMVRPLGHDLLFLNRQSPFYGPYTRLGGR